MPQLEESLRRAERAHAAALRKGDAKQAAVIARAIEVLEQAARGEVPQQRSPSE